MREGMSLAEEMRGVMEKAILKNKLYAENVAAPYYYKHALKQIRIAAENGSGHFFFDPNLIRYAFFEMGNYIRPEYSVKAAEKIAEMLEKEGFRSYYDAGHNAVYICWSEK